MAGIVGYGAFIPRNRVTAEEIAKQWGKDPAAIRRGLLLEEKSVPGLDEDTITISVAAGRAALERAGVDPQRVGALYIGSESHPYAVKPSGTVVAEALGIGPEVHIADFEFACKAGTEAMFVAFGLVESGRVEYAMGIGADTSQGAPNDALEYSASAGGAAFLFGRQHVLADVVETYSYTSDTPDFWRREGEFYPRHGGRFTGEPAYFRHVTAATRAILDKTGLEPAAFRYAVFHMPNGKFPLAVGKQLGFTREQLEVGWIVPTMGNTYSGSSPTGLAAILDEAEADDLILITSFGSGAGSDSFVLRATDLLADRRTRAPTVRSMLEGRRRYLTYGEYAKYREKIILNA
ncbi:MAG: hydroxymethylglutaryl-CoA synthase [Gemmatimonadota bacterium]|nr:hydroxymethylglutaryl-CoA synthase [Gemmatimonadota bacterium]MDH3366993.1 hydroxymethylglutaryl-CoA synthase [Gemmatimonadota bacterium]MDH3476729.1 hydroxymethylglutaryl-CoA synthase [Gemmatimonadota bacterium]MDH3569627.1 hydroxymethylglutaryl-CoA synthase [Gemmatimonadota bacterium]MDH5549781.1 hydroxymethylglutaryl-CoA synthase [Gemmatimonadota bacterium]